MRRLALLALVPLLLLDCLANFFLGGSIQRTLSAEAWMHRDHSVWGWTHRAIDALFFWQPDHCRKQAEREHPHGVWRAWRADWKSL